MIKTIINWLKSKKGIKQLINSKELTEKQIFIETEKYRLFKELIETGELKGHTINYPYAKFENNLFFYTNKYCRLVQTNLLDILEILESKANVSWDIKELELETLKQIEENQKYIKDFYLKLNSVKVLPVLNE